MLDSNGRKIETDHAASGYNESYLVGIDIAHHKIHSGHHFSCQDYDDEVDIAGPKYWHLIAPSSNRVHLTYIVSASLPGLLELYEDPTTSDDGTVLTPYNNDRNSSTTSDLSVFYDPTVSDDGARLCPVVLGSTGTNPVGATGGIIRRESEVILADDTAYLIKFSPFNNDAIVSICLDYYEVTPAADDGV